ncbi:hypothetical protein GJ496_006960 [Pomphorhynchus laevis]|nr:hypothetical protein GJ496_006960 [Pomphorhynchus laevis]
MEGDQGDPAACPDNFTINTQQQNQTTNNECESFCIPVSSSVISDVNYHSNIPQSNSSNRYSTVSSDESSFHQTVQPELETQQQSYVKPSRCNTTGRRRGHRGSGNKRTTNTEIRLPQANTSCNNSANGQSFELSDTDRSNKPATDPAASFMNTMATLVESMSNSTGNAPNIPANLLSLFPPSLLVPGGIEQTFFERFPWLLQQLSQSALDNGMYGLGAAVPFSPAALASWNILSGGSVSPNCVGTSLPSESTASSKPRCESGDAAINFVANNTVSPSLFPGNSVDEPYSSVLSHMGNSDQNSGEYAIKNYLTTNDTRGKSSKSVEAVVAKLRLNHNQSTEEKKNMQDVVNLKTDQYTIRDILESTDCSGNTMVAKTPSLSDRGDEVPNHGHATFSEGNERYPFSRRTSFNTDERDSDDNNVIKRRRKPDEPDEVLIRLPLTLGWLRKTHVRLITKTGVRGDVVYFSPDGRKLKSFQEIDRFLLRCESSELTRQNFTFSSKLLIGAFVQHHRDESNNIVSNEVSEADIIEQIRQINPDFQKYQQATCKVDSNQELDSAKKMRTLPLHSRRRMSVQFNCKEAAPQQQNTSSSTTIIDKSSPSHHQYHQNIPPIDSNSSACEFSHMTSQPNSQLTISDILKSCIRNHKNLNPPLSSNLPNVDDKDGGTIQTIYNNRLIENSPKQQTKAYYNTGRDHAAILQAKLKQQKMIDTAFVNELKSSTEDLLIKELKPLPEYSPVTDIIVSSKAYADCLVLIEFLASFAYTLQIDLNDIPNIADLQKSLISDIDSDSADSSYFFLILRFLLQLCLLDNCNGRKKLSEIELNSTTVSDVLRIFVLDRVGDNELSKSLSASSVFTVDPATKASLLAFLCGELLTSKLISDCIDSNLSKLVNLRHRKWEIEGHIRKLRLEVCKAEADHIRDDCSSLTTTGEQQTNQDNKSVEGSSSLCSTRVDQQPDYYSDSSKMMSTIANIATNSKQSLADDINNGDYGVEDTAEPEELVDNSDDPDEEDDDGADDDDVEEEHDEDIGGRDEDLTAELNKNVKITLNPGEDVEVQITNLINESEMIKKTVNQRTSLMRCSQLGQDRYYRRYWLFPRLGAIYVEAVDGGDDELKPSDCEEFDQRPSLNNSGHHDIQKAEDQHDDSCSNDMDEQNTCLTDEFLTKLQLTNNDMHDPDDFYLVEELNDLSLKRRLRCWIFPVCDLMKAFLTEKLHFLKINGKCRRKYSPVKDEHTAYQPIEVITEEEAVRLAKEKFQFDVPQAIPPEMQNGWWYINDIETIRALLMSLNKRGIREKNLYRSITKNIEQIEFAFYRKEMMLNQAGINKLDDTSSTHVDTKSEYSILPGKQTASSFIDNSAASSKNQDHFAVAALLENLYTLEDKVMMASLQARGTGVDSRHSLPKSTSFVDGMEMARNRLAGLERIIERRYLKAPFASQVDTSKLSCVGTDDDETESMNKWRRSVQDACNASQLALCLIELDRHIAWEKSIMRVICQICNKDENEDRLLLCDGCDRGHHTYCFIPPITEIPDGDWFCLCCMSKSQRKSICFICGNGNILSSMIGFTENLILLCCDNCNKYFHAECHIGSTVTRTKCLCLLCSSNNRSSKRSRIEEPSLNQKSVNLQNQRCNSPSLSPPDIKKPFLLPQRTTDDHCMSNLNNHAYNSVANVSKKRRTRAQSTDDRNTDFHQKCRDLVTELFKHQSSWPFREPVDEKLYPEYYKVIKYPIDLQVIKKKAKCNQYSSVNEFAADVRLIFENCHFYNEDDSLIGQAASGS